MSNTPDELDKTFTTFHHEIAEQLGYKQTPGYASWDKVETTAPVQAIDRLVAYIKANYRHIDDIRGAIGEDEAEVSSQGGYYEAYARNKFRQIQRQALNIGDSDE